jgi:putative ABC transport system substrate-binding protein
MVKKTVVVLLVVLALASLRLAEAQQPKKVPRIGILSPTSSSSSSARVEAFRQGLSDLGYVEGKNIVIEYRYAGGKLEQLPELAMELVHLKVDVIVTSGPAAFAAKKATNAIPIVIAAAADPVGTGLVASLARPEGNVTGLTIMSPELGGKRLELLKEAFPKLTRVAVLWAVGNPRGDLPFREVEAPAKALGIKLQSLGVRSLDDFENAFEAARRQSAQALITAPQPVINVQRERIVDFAAKSRLPAIYATSEFVDAGGLMSYAPSYTDLHRRAATYVDKILKGAKPADLPVEQPIKFEFVVNLKAAKAIGLTIPPNVLARADRVIK